MYEKLNITENHLRILVQFTRGFEKEYYIREVQRLIHCSPRTAQLILDDLEKKAVLESKTRGKIRTYKLKKNRIAYDYLIFTEIYKKIAFLSENKVIKEIVEKIVHHIEGIGILFGSYVKKKEKKESDIDLFVAGDIDREEIEKIAKLYGKDIQIKNYPLSLFKKEIKHDVLIKEVLKDHVIIKGSEEVIELVMRNG